MYMRMSAIAALAERPELALVEDKNKSALSQISEAA